MERNSLKTNTWRCYLVTLLLLSLCSSQGFARDLHGRFGLGYNNEFANAEGSNSVPGISLKYGLTRAIAINPIFGVRTSSPSNTVAALKFYKNIFYETNLNFHFMFGGGVITADSRTAADFISGFGAEFFIPGVESLGISVEVGGGFSNVTDEFVFRTLGMSILDAGVHFYF